MRMQAARSPRRDPAGASRQGASRQGAPSVAGLLELQRTAGNGAVAALLARRGDAPIPRTVQRAVSSSATYAPGTAALALITELDHEVSSAEDLAEEELENPTDGLHTAVEAAYLNNPSDRAWGYCVEAHLNAIAAGFGWATQHRLLGSRPDYHRTIPGPAGQRTEVFADLTTVYEAGLHGDHVTTKLMTADPNLAQVGAWQAADITHSGPPGGAVPVLQTNGEVTAEHARAFDVYRAARLDRGDHVPGLLEIDGPLTSATFTQSWDEDARSRFAAQVFRALVLATRGRTAGPPRRSARVADILRGPGPVNLKPSHKRHKRR